MRKHHVAGMRPRAQRESQRDCRDDVHRCASSSSSHPPNRLDTRRHHRTTTSTQATVHRNSITRCTTQSNSRGESATDEVCSRSGDVFDDTCRIEIDQLQQQVVAEREKYHEQTSQETVGRRAHAPCTTQQGDGLSAVSLFPINDRFALIEGEAEVAVARFVRPNSAP